MKYIGYYKKNEEVASNAGSSSAVPPVFELLSNCCNQNGLVLMVRNVRVGMAQTDVRNPYIVCTQMQCHGVLLGQLRQSAVKQEI